MKNDKSFHKKKDQLYKEIGEITAAMKIETDQKILTGLKERLLYLKGWLDSLHWMDQDF